MSHPSWGMFFALVVINIVALRLALTTKIEPKDKDPRVQMFRGIARNTGFIVGIGGWVPAIRILIDLLNR